MSIPSTSSEAFFEAKYQAASDPWSFATDTYEQSRYAAVLEMIAGRRYQLAFEPGCSVGALTEQLAAQCDRVEAFDISPTAAAQAAERCACLANVHIRHAALGEILPVAADLLVFCEVGYYQDRASLRHLLDSYVEALADGAALLACHWLGHSPDHCLHGDEVHDELHATTGLAHVAGRHEPRFRIDLWRKVSA